MKPPNPREYVSDAARRCADIINGYIHSHPWNDLKNQWVAISLENGGSDGVLYDSKRDAVNHQSDEFRCAYVCFRNLAGGITPVEAERYITWNRAAYRAGFRLPDPDAQHGGPEVFPTVAQYDRLARNHVQRYFQAIGAIDLSNFGKS